MELVVAGGPFACATPYNLCACHTKMRTEVVAEHVWERTKAASRAERSAKLCATLRYVCSIACAALSHSSMQLGRRSSVHSVA